MKKLVKALAASLLAMTCAACGNSNTVSGIVNKGVVMPSDGYAQGSAGDTLRTAWFDFTVNSASLAESYGSIVPDENESLLVVNITLKNTIDAPITMFDSDFQAQWGSEGENDFRFPVTYDDPSRREKDMLEAEYELGAGNTLTGDLVYSVPGGQQEYSLSFQEYYQPEEGQEAGKTGDLFFVFFHAE